jgi:hypothetical protein
MDEPRDNQIRVSVPEDVVAGYYANVVGVWHTAHEFAIDFCVVQPFVESPEDGVTDARVVARVRVPPTIVFDLLRSINENLAEYEHRYGHIRRPGEPADIQGDETDD